MTNDKLELLIFSFWDYSTGRINGFDFPEFFDEFAQILYRKLSSHGWLGLNNYIEVVMKNHYDIEKLRFLEYKSIHTDREFLMDSILEGIFRPRYEHHRQKHKNNEKYLILFNLHHELKYYNKYTHVEKVLLVDKCIHTMHNSGFILDIDSIMAEYDAIGAMK